MKREIIALLLLSGFALNACKTNKENHSERIISVTILPQKYFTQKIAGPEYQINVLIPPGASPENYEPSPRQLQELHRSNAYFLIGELASEKAWTSDFQKNNTEIAFIDLSEGIEFIQSVENHGDHQHTGADPHIWMSPVNALKMSENLLAGLIKVFPEDSLLFQSNYQSLVLEILQIDSLYRNSSAKLQGLNFLIYHPALGYLANDYGMVQHVLEFEGKEPPPSHIARLINEAKTHHIDFIFVQSQFSMDNARSIAREINARVIPIDPLTDDWPGELKKIHSYLTE